jgi:cytochrome c oxidase subunit 2
MEDAAGTFWFWMWIAALAVGAVVWGLILFSAFAYRKRNEDLPPQTRYNIPIEALYTAVPFIIIAALFYWELRIENAVTGKDHFTDPSVTVDVVGQKWAWTFNYTDDNVYDVGVSSAAGRTTDLATLYLPVDERIEFRLHSPDVIHSFWVPAFYRKMDVIPGRVNSFQITLTEPGDYIGRCAELCGTYHSRMLFNVKVVERSEYNSRMRALAAAGQTGQTGIDNADYDSGSGGESRGTGQGEGSGNE